MTAHECLDVVWEAVKGPLRDRLADFFLFAEDRLHAKGLLIGGIQDYKREDVDLILPSRGWQIPIMFHERWEIGRMSAIVMTDSGWGQRSVFFLVMMLKLYPTGAARKLVFYENSEDYECSRWKEDMEAALSEITFDHEKLLRDIEQDFPPAFGPKMWRPKK